MGRPKPPLAREDMAAEQNRGQRRAPLPAESPRLLLVRGVARVLDSFAWSSFSPNETPDPPLARCMLCTTATLLDFIPIRCWVSFIPPVLAFLSLFLKRASC